MPNMPLTEKKLSETKISSRTAEKHFLTRPRTNIKTGIQDDEYIQILEGLKENEEIVSGPYTAISKTLEEGTKIRRVTEDELYDRKKKK